MKVSVPEYAASEGITRQTAHERLRRIGLRVPRGGKIDPEVINAKLARTRDAVQAARNPSGKAKSAPAATHVEPQAIAPKQRDDSLPEAQRAKEWLSVKEKKLKLEQLEGKLISRADVEATAFEQARRERDALLAWPARVSPIIAGELDADAHKLFVLLDQHVREFLEEPI